MGCLMKKILLLILILIFCKGLIYSKEDIKYLREDVINDMNYIVEKAEEIHPNLYHSITKEEIESYIIEYIERLPNQISEKQVKKEFAELIIQFQEGHSLALDYYFLMKKSKNKTIPFKIYWKNEKCYIIKALNQELIGKELLKINNVSISEILKNISKIIPSETLSWKDWNINENFSLYYNLLYGLSDSYEILYKGEVYNNEIEIKGVSFEEYKNVVRIKRDKYNLDILSDKLAIIRIDSFDEEKEYDEFIEMTFSKLKKYKIKNIIIDIRNNGGGTTNSSEILIRYISKGKIKNGLIESKISKEFKEVYRNDKEIQNAKLGSILKRKRQQLNSLGRYDGKVFVLSGGGSFSTATSFLAMVKDNELGIIVGTESGTFASAYGEPYLIVTPNTKNKILISTKYIIRPNEERSKHGVIPDIIVEAKMEDLLNGIDTPVEYIKQNLIK